MYYLYNSRLNNYSGQKGSMLMYFQLELDYYSNEPNKKKNVQLSVNSINKKQLQDR